MCRIAYMSFCLGLAFAFALTVPAVADPKLRAAGGGAVRTLIVGVDKYRNLGEKAQLHGAAADSRDIAQVLSAAGVSVQIIVNEEASRARFITEMDRLVATSRAGDLVIISFAGHGMQVPEYSRWKGIEPNGVNEQIAFSGYSFSGDGAREILVNKELKAWLSRFDAKRVDTLVIMDSCFGGGMKRAVDWRSGRMALRVLPGDAKNSEREKFVPIPMTEKEARVEIRSLPHVTFLAGATTNSVVPETTGLDPRDTNGARGALSFFIARAIEDAVRSDVELTRDQLFKFVGQNVRQVTNEHQLIEFEPRVAEKSSLDRPVIRVATGSAPNAGVESVNVGRLPIGSSGEPLRVAVVNGPVEALGGVEKGVAPFVVARSPDDADLVWDTGKREAIAHGDIVMRGVDGSLLGEVIDRGYAIRAIQRLAAPRVLSLRLREEGKTYIPGESPEIVANGVGGRSLIVFNIAADGELQLLFPVNGLVPDVSSDEWVYRPNVTKPFGADYVVATSSAHASIELLKWFKEHNQKHDAVLLVDKLAQFAADDPTLRIGAVGLYTSASRE